MCYTLICTHEPCGPTEVPFFLPLVESSSPHIRHLCEKVDARGIHCVCTGRIGVPQNTDGANNGGKVTESPIGRVFALHTVGTGYPRVPH